MNVSADVSSMCIPSGIRPHRRGGKLSATISPAVHFPPFAKENPRHRLVGHHDEPTIVRSTDTAAADCADVDANLTTARVARPGNGGGALTLSAAIRAGHNCVVRRRAAADGRWHPICEHHSHDGGAGRGRSSDGNHQGIVQRTWAVEAAVTHCGSLFPRGLPFLCLTHAAG